jgi:hypothetical protein
MENFISITIFAAPRALSHLEKKKKKKKEVFSISDDELFNAL